MIQPKMTWLDNALVKTTRWYNHSKKNTCILYAIYRMFYNCIHNLIHVCFGFFSYKYDVDWILLKNLTYYVSIQGCRYCSDIWEDAYQLNTMLLSIENYAIFEALNICKWLQYSVRNNSWQDSFQNSLSFTQKCFATLHKITLLLKPLLLYWCPHCCYILDTRYLSYMARFHKGEILRGTTVAKLAPGVS